MMGLLLLLTFACFGLTIWAQFKVKGNYNQWSKVAASSGLTGAEVARQILDQNGLYDVAVEPVRGVLSDHYDPIKRVVRLWKTTTTGVPLLPFPSPLTRSGTPFSTRSSTACSSCATACSPS